MSEYLYLTLDVARTGVQETLSGAYIGDNEKALFIVLSKGEEAYTPPTGSMAVMYTEKPDGTHGMYSCVIENGYVIAPIAPQMVTVAGNVRCQVEIITANHTVLYCPEFILTVARSVPSEIEIESIDDFQVISELVQDVSFVKVHGVITVEELPESTQENPIKEDTVVYLIGAGFYRYEGSEWRESTRDSTIEDVDALQEDIALLRGDIESLQAESHTHNNKGVLDEINAAKVNRWNTAYANTHTHANKAAIDSVTMEKITVWDSAATDEHTHANKELLDKLSVYDLEVFYNRIPIGIIVSDSWPDTYMYRHKVLYHTGYNNADYAGLYYSDGVSWIAIAKNKVIQNSHMHSNQSALDCVTSEKVTAWDGAVTDKHTHANKAALDSVTAEKVTAWDGAVTDKHTHTNKSALDSVTAEKVTAWDGAVTDKHAHANRSALDKVTESNGKLLFDGDPIGGGIQTVATPNALPANAENGSSCIALNDYEHIEAVAYPGTQTDEMVEISVDGKRILFGAPTYNETAINALIAEGEYMAYGEIRALAMQNTFSARSNIRTIPVVENVTDNAYASAGIDLNEEFAMIADSCVKKYLIEVQIPAGCGIIQRLDRSHVAVPVLGVYTFENLSGTYRDIDRYTFKAGWNVQCFIFEYSGDLADMPSLSSLTKTAAVVTCNVDINEYVQFQTDESSCVCVIDSPETELLDGLIYTKEVKKKGLYIKVSGTWERIDEQSHTHKNKADLDGLTASMIDGFADASEKKHTHSNKNVLDKFSQTNDKLLFDGDPVGGVQTVANPSALPANAANGSVAVALSDDPAQTIVYPSQTADEAVSVNIAGMDIAIGTPSYNATAIAAAISAQDISARGTVELGNGASIQFTIEPVVPDAADNAYTLGGITLDEDAITDVPTSTKLYGILADWGESYADVVKPDKIVQVDAEHEKIPISGFFAFEDLETEDGDALSAGWNVFCVTVDTASHSVLTDAEYETGVDINEYLNLPASDENAMTIEGTSGSLLFDGIVKPAGQARQKGLYVKLGDDWNRATLEGGTS